VEDLYRKEIDLMSGGKGMLEIIDTAGTEQFTSMVEMYIRNCQGFILVYDVTKKTSFDGLTAIKDLVFKTTNSTPKTCPPMIIVGNKIDDPDRQVLFAAGYGIAKEWGAHFLESSAKTRVKVDEIFFGIAKLLEQKQDKSGCCVLL
jgi:small GTP-binding protein